MTYALFGLLLNDGEREKLHELCIREGIPITFPELFDKDTPMKYMWSFRATGIGGAGTIVMRHLKADGIPIIHGVKELEEFFSSEVWAEHKLEMAKKVYVEIKSKEDEIKWKEFLKHYFPNHYASRLLDDDLVIDIDARDNGRGYINKSIAVSTKGYGYITLKFASIGGYKEVNNFEEFKLTKCYKSILSQGVTLDVGKPGIIDLKGN